MAPEQFEGKAVFASDIYSAGCLFYEMVTGFPPIVLANPMEIYKAAKAGNITPLIKKCPTVTPQLNWVAMKILSPDLSTRYRHVSDIINDLDKMEQKKSDNSDEIKKIKNRIDARGQRDDHMCWNCHKTMPRKLTTCIYCGAEQ
jgi:serine/threonine protein kinase